MIRSPLLAAQLQETMGAPSTEAALSRWREIAAAEPGLERLLQAIDATYDRFGMVQQVSAEVGACIVSEWDMKTTRIESGKGWKALLGYAAGDVPDTVLAWRSLMHPEDLRGLMAQIGEHVRESTPRFSAPCRGRMPDGSWRWLRVSGRVVACDDNGEPLRLVVVHQDIDAEHRLEVSLAAARDAAEAAGRARSAFLANMSHEIRTPMNGILGMMELALDTELDAEQRHYLSTVRSSCDTLLTIVNDILDFSKIEAGKLEIERVDFSLSEVVFEAVRSQALDAQKKGLDVVVDVASELPARVWGDPIRLRQVLTNLVGNAIKFTAEGEVVVALRPQSVAVDNVVLLVSVRDTGIGIPQDKQQQIFEAFSQADVSTTRRFGGTGLGLAISARLVELMGGQLSVSSEPGRGSEFVFSLSLGISQGAIPRGLPGELVGQRVLLVGRESASFRMLQARFSALGMEAVLVDGLAAARDAADKWRGAGFPFGLVVCDAEAVLADDGDTFGAWQAASTERFIVLLTVVGQREQLPLLKALGVTAYVVKPIAIGDLLDAASLVVEGEHGLRLDPFDVDASLRSEEAAAGGLGVLLVEDNPINQELAQRLLEKDGHRVTLATNGQEALEQFDLQSFDVILMDMQMPVMGGIEATQAIRARELRRSWVASGPVLATTPIIAMTANAMAGDRERCLQAGMNDYLAKPIRHVDLQAALARAVRGESAPAVAAPEHAVTASASPAVLDIDAATRDIGDAALVREMARMLLLHWDADLAAIENALLAKNGATLQRSSHTLKGLLAMFHAEPARQAALAVELAARDSRWDDAGGLLADLRGELDRLRPELEAFVGV